ncbi:MAG: phosphoribosylglycinamide formyltransferase [Planctomycetes bacterium]|nr:phosphoribosylglycinamide formyltransferase [Planctomycetota bacterium]
MSPSPTNPLPIAVLISGGGTTLRNLLQKRAAGELDAQVALVISSDPDAAGLRYATEADIPTCVVERKSCDTPQAFSDAVFSPCREAGVQLVVMGGFLQHVLIPADFKNRVVNIHPGLIPAFCGKGMYGHRVHVAVLEYGAKVSGCTIHFVDDHYDHGPVILQRVVPVEEDDTPELLAARIFEAECAAYPEAINLIAGGRVQVEDRRVRIRP